MAAPKSDPKHHLKRPSLYAVRLVAIGEVSGPLARRVLSILERPQHVEGMFQLWARQPMIQSRPSSLDVAETRLGEILTLMTGMAEPPVAAEIVSVSPANLPRRRKPPLIES